MATPPDIILLDALSTTGSSGGLGIQGQAMRYGNTGSAVANQNYFPFKYKARVQLADTTSGASATVKIQTSPDNVTYTDVYSFSLSIGAGNKTNASSKLFSTNVRYIRAQVSAIAGGSAPKVNAYVTLGTFGV